MDVHRQPADQRGQCPGLRFRQSGQEVGLGRCDTFLVVGQHCPPAVGGDDLPRPAVGRVGDALDDAGIHQGNDQVGQDDPVDGSTVVPYRWQVTEIP